MESRDNTATIQKKAHLFVCASSNESVLFYQAAVKRMLASAITVRFGNLSAEDQSLLNKATSTVSKTTRCDLQALAKKNIYNAI